MSCKKLICSASFVSVVGLVIFAVPSLTCAEEPMQITIGQSVVSVHAGQRTLLRYRYENVPFKPYVDRFFSPGGVNVLRDAPADHLHHHALMFAVAVDGVNFWEERQASGRQVHQSFSDVRVGGESDNVPRAVLTQHIDWINAQSSELILKERRTIEVCELKDAEVTILIWQSILEVPPGKSSVTLTGSHYFGLGMRFVKSMDTSGWFSNVDGKTSDVVRGDERLVQSKWCGYTASANGQPVTIAMFDHPQNRRPVTWFTMTKPFAYLSATLSLHKELLKLTSDTPLVLRYGVALWDGQVKEDQIERLYKQWVAWSHQERQLLLRQVK